MYEEERYPEQRTFSMALYMIAGTSAVLQMFSSTIVLGLILLVLSFFMSKAQRMTARDTTYASHVEYLSRTLSIGTFILFPISAVIAIYMIYTSTDFASLQNAMNSDDMDVLMSGIQAYISRSSAYAQHITMMSLALPVFWWVRRCFVGFLYAKNHEPIFYPEGIL